MKRNERIYHVVHQQLPPLALVLAASAIAAYTDLRTRRIPNVLSGIVLAAGLALSVASGWQHAVISAILCITVFVIGTLLFSLRLIGGGDVKLLAAAAAALGWPDTAAFLLYTVLAGGLIGIAITIARGRMRPMLINLKAIALPMLSGLLPTAAASAGGSMPYGLAIFAGAVSLTAGDTLGLSRMFL